MNRSCRTNVWSKGHFRPPWKTFLRYVMAYFKLCKHSSGISQTRRIVMAFLKIRNFVMGHIESIFQNYGECLNIKLLLRERKTICFARIIALSLLPSVFACTSLQSFWGKKSLESCPETRCRDQAQRAPA